MSAITAKARRKMKKYAVLTREPRCFLGSFDFSWEQRKAIDIADYSKGNGYSKGDLTDAGTPIILYGRLYTKYQFAISEVDTFAVPRNGAVYSQGNEVIVPASGETAEDIARASAVEKSGVLLGGDLNILRAFDFINPLFLALAISNGEPQKELAKKAQGKSVVHIHNTDIQEVTIAYPSRTEQDRIVSVFRQLDNLITLHQRKCVFLFSFFRACISMNFTASTFSWEQRKVQDVANRFDNLRIPVAANLRVHGTTPYYGANGIQDYVEGFTHDGEFVLVAEDGANDLKNYPVKCVNERIWVNNHAHVLQGKAGIADNSFLAFAISQSDIESLLVGGGRAKLNAETLMSIEFRLPCLQEQYRIGEYLTQLDHLITLHQRKFEKLTNVKKSMLEKMFPQNGSSYPEIRFKGFTDPWEQRKLSEIATMHARIGWQNLRTSEFLDSGDYMLITGTDFIDGAVNFDTCHYVERERYEQDKHIQIRNGSILITKDGTLGKVAYIQGLTMPATLNAGVFNVEIKDENEVDNRYLFQYLKAPFLMDYVDKKATGGTIKHLNQNILVDFPVVLPHKAEQEKIGEYFLAIDHLITLHQRELEKLQNIKKSMLEKMFV